MFNRFYQDKTLPGLLVLCMAVAVFAAAPVQAACPGADGSVAGSQLVIYEDCTEAKGGGTAITITSPAGTAVGDLLVVAISTDGNPAITPPGTWTTLDDGPAGNSQARLGVYSFVATAAGAQNYAFSLSASEDYYAWMMRFTNHDGIDPGEVAFNAGTTGFPVAPAITPQYDNTLIVRLAGNDDDDGSIDPATIITGHRNITQDDTGNGPNTTSAAAAYFNQVSGNVSVGTAQFLSSGGGSEEWRTVTFGIRPKLPAVAFRITHSGSGTTCSATTVTFTAVNLLGLPVTDFTGTVTIVAPNGDWVVNTAANGGSFNNDTPGNGDFTYTFVAGDNGDAAFDYFPSVAGTNINIDIADDATGLITETSGPPGAGIDQEMNVGQCGFTVTHDGNYGTCNAFEAITITAVDPDGLQVAGFTGEVRIVTTATTDTGTWSLGAGASGTITALGNGDIDYQFSALDNGQVVLNYTHLVDPDSVDFNLFDTREPAIDADKGTDPQLTVNPCGYIITHDGYAGTCGYELVTITDIEPLTLETISGTTTTTLGNGTWALESGAGTFTPLANGNFEYTYHADDNGEAVFRYYHPVAELVALDVQVDGISEVVSSSGDLNVSDCELFFDTISDGQNCRQQTFTLTAAASADPGSNPVAGYTATVSLSTSTLQGDWAAATGSGVLNNGAGGDGDATYTFALADNGTVTFEFNYTDPATAMTVTADDTFNSITATSNAFDIFACSFRLSFETSGSTCVPSAVSISVWDSNNTKITDFTGKVDISTTFNNGDWSLSPLTPTANAGSFTNFGDGAAEYTFVAGDGGEIWLELEDEIVENTKIIVADESGLLAVDPLYNPTLAVAACRFVISHVNSADVCSPVAVTFSLVDPGGNPASDFDGQIFISTSAPGTWSDGTTSGIVDTGGGSANYQFTAPNSATVTFTFQGDAIGTFDIDVTSGSNTDNDGDPGEDPPLELTTCIPLITDFSCVNTNNTSIDILSSVDSLGTRAVVMVTGMETDTAITAPLFGGFSPTGNVLSLSNSGNPTNSRTYTEMYAWLDSDLPAGSGSFTGSFSGGGGAGHPMCLIALKNVDQSLPVAPALGSSTGDAGGVISSSLTSPADGAIVISAASVDELGGFGANTLNGQPGNLLGSFSEAADSFSFGANWASVGAGAVTITENFLGTNDRYTHIAAAFATAPAPLSYFKITHDGSTTACTMQQVTIEAYDINGNIKTDYTGTITLSMAEAHGTWSQFLVTGVLTENPLDDDGTATYQFAASDNGSKTLSLLVPHNDTFVISVVDGSIEDDGTHPPLFVSSCEPVLYDTQCYTGTAGTVDIPGLETSSARAVIMSIARESNPGSDPAIDPASVLFDISGTPTAMSNVATAKANNGSDVNTTEMWIIYDADMPTAAGTYGASFNVVGGSFDNNKSPAMCLTSVYGIDQTLPVYPAVATSTVTVSPTSVTTTVTTTGNNALLMSIVSDNRNSGNYASSLDTTLWNNETPPNSAVFSGFSGLHAQQGPASDTLTPSSAPDLISHILASFSPVVAGPPTADDFEPVSLYKSFSGVVNYRAYGSSYRLNPNGVNVQACAFADPNTGTSIDVDVPPGSTILGAYLYWTGDGDEEVSPLQIDDDVQLLRGTETFTITADEIFLIKNIGLNSNLDYFTGFKDVTTIVNTNGTYTLRDLVSQSGSPWQDTSACAAGWALVVVYENGLEDIQVINLFHGFQPFQNSNFQLVPRNFRIRANDVANGLPHGQLTHISIEGDPDISSANERLGLQTAPGSPTFNYLTNSFNPATGQYNSTVTRPIYDGLLEWSPTAGVNMDGYEALSTTSYGVDVDTHFLQGDSIGSPLYQFGITTPLPEEITTEYGAGQDLVLLVAEVVSITNAPIADLEVTLTEGPPFIVGETSTYTISLANNGDGTGPEGDLTGSATVTVTFPAGLTITGTVTATGWSCVANNSPPATLLGLAALACEYDIATPLAEGASLPSITVPIAIGDESVFPNLVNQAEVNVRALYHGGNCVPDPLDDSLAGFGTSPDPDECGISPQFDNVMDLQGGALSMNDLEEKSVNNNNVDARTTTINGRKADLQLTKVAGIFTEASIATYTITVTNLGPQTAAKLITVTDTLPAGLTFAGKLETGDDDAWSCSAVGQAVTCTTDTDLAPAESADFLLGVQLSSPAIENANVNNTACVSIATGNFDTNAANNCDTESVTVQGEPVAGQNKFLISVNLDNTGLGSGTGTLTFNSNDIILYDPVTDAATMFFDDDVVNGNSAGDINALHVRRNGHIIVSPAAAGSIAGVSYDVGDLLVYDPLLDTATLLFDGSAHFDSPTTNIDAVFEQNDGQVVISTTADAGMNGTLWQMGDLVRFDPAAPSPTVTVVLDGDDAAVFNASVQLNGTYFKVGGTPSYVITIGQSSANIATGNTTLTGDDIASLQPGIDSALEFRGSLPNGVFDPLTSTRFIDGVHLYESAYFGHFAITESVSGDTCTPTTIVIRKDNFDDTADTSYTGSILIDIDYLGAATWSKIAGNGTLQPTGNGNQYIYTFVPSDNGEVTLALTITEDGVDVNVDVTNGLVTESATEDPVISFNDVISPVTYADDFSSGGFTGNTGTSNFESGWVETDADGPGAGTGNVQVIAGEAYFDNVPNSQTLENNMPALVREVDLSLYTPGTLTLTFDWRTVGANSGDSFVVEARGDASLDAWVNVATFTGLAGANAGSESYNLTSILSGAGQSVSSNTQIRYRVAANYNVSGSFIIDNVQLGTSTSDCGVGAVHHYEISHVGYGVMCEAYQITFEAHDIAHTPIAPTLGTVVNLSTSAGKGSWSPLPAFPNTADTVLGDGQATYSFGLNQASFSVNYNLTNPLTPTETIHFNIQQGAITELGLPGDVTDPLFTFAEAGFIFTDSGGTQNIGLQIAGKRSNLAPANGIFLRAVDTNLDTLECEALFGGQTVQIEMQVQCSNPSSCATTGATINGTVVPENDDYIPGPGGTLDNEVAVSFAPASAISDEIILNYPDAGEIQIHAEYEIPIGNDITANTEMGFMRGSSQPFVVRPFGFRFDMSANTDPFADDGTPDDGFGNPDAGGSAFVKAGQPFTVNLQAVAYVEGAGQDTLVPGHPDPGADLAANPLTPNFGNENSPVDRPVATLTHTVTLPLEYNPGALSGTVTFDAFSGGQDANNDISFSEVGIIDLEANLVGGYLGSGSGLRGFVNNVGRFIPDHYAITSSAHVNRVGLDGFCTPASTFTYMGEPVELTVNLRAENAEGNPTRNYYGDFERLTTALGVLNFSAMDLETMDVLTGRLDTSAVNTVAWNSVFLNGDTGEGVVSGNLILDKAALPDGPYDMFSVGLVPVDADGVTVLAADLNLDLPPLGSTDTVTVMTTGMRYGRLTINSTGGSEISESTVPGAGIDIPVTFVLEYYNSGVMNFLVNPLDDCTTLSSSNLVVIGDSYSEDLTANPLGVGAPAPGLSINIGVQTGTLTVLENGSTSTSSASGDVPFYISSPFAADDPDTATGSVLLELDLDTAVDVDPGAGVQNVIYDYLKFDWRSAGELYDEVPDGTIQDSPRAIIDFGVFQGHNRVINWQEILLTP